MTTHHLYTNDDIVDENDACSHLYEPVDRMEAISARVAEGDRDTLELEMRNEECLTKNVAYQVARNEWRFQVDVGINLEAREGGKYTSKPGLPSDKVNRAVSSGARGRKWHMHLHTSWLHAGRELRYYGSTTVTSTSAIISAYVYTCKIIMYNMPYYCHSLVPMYVYVFMYIW